MAEKKSATQQQQMLELAERVPAPEDMAALQKSAEAVFAKPLFFICGAIKSGTTWLQLMLHAHPEIACRGEGHLANILLPGMGAALQKYNNQIAFKNNSIFNEIEGFPRFGGAQHYVLFRTAIGLLLAQYDRDDIRFIGEKSPDNVLALPIMGRLFPEAKILHLIRDGRDAAVSGWFHNLRVSKEWAEKEFGSLKAFAEHFAQGWVRSIDAGRDFGAQHPERYFELRYENLLSDGAGELRAVLNFLGASDGETDIANCLKAASFESLAKGRGAGEEDRGSHFRKGVQGDWREHFDAEIHTAFRARAGAQLTALGYDEEN